MGRFSKNHSILSIVASQLLLGAGVTFTAATIDVNSTSGTTSPVDCTLIDAIISANTGAPSGGCLTGSAGADTIDLSAIAPAAITLNSRYPSSGAGLPTVTSNITIEGYGSTVERNTSAPKFSIVDVEPNGDLTIDDLTLTGGDASSGDGGGGIINRGNLTLNESTVSSNTSHHGGGIWNVDDANLTLRRSIVSANTARDNGGGISNDFGSIAILDSNISDNYANFGGGIANYNGTATISGSTLSGNYAYYYGGGIANDYGSVTVSSSTLSGNYANFGGGIANYNGTATISGSTLSGNYAYYYGGGILNENNASITINDSNISENNATYIGGGLANMVDSNMTLNHCNVTDNNTSNGGGGIINADYSYYYGSGSDRPSILTINHSTITGNAVMPPNEGNNNYGYGGGILSTFGAETFVNESTISGNTAPMGGGIANMPIMQAQNKIPPRALEVNGSIVSENFAFIGGGIVNAFGSSATLHDSSVSKNTASFRAEGVLNLYESNITISDSNISDNNGSGYGGGITNLYGSKADIQGSTISGNLAVKAAGFVNSADSNATLTNVTVSGNNAAESIGGIMNGYSNDTSDSSILIITNSTIVDNNDANASAGTGIHNIADLNLINTIVANNVNSDFNGNAPLIHTNNLVMSIGNGSWTPMLSDDPVLGPLADNGGPTLTHALLTGSPAIDNASATGAPATDQRGVARPQGAGFDIGAYEGIFVPDLNVSGNGLMIKDGDATPSLDDGTDFSSVVIGSPFIETFNVDSNGSDDLNLTALSVPAGFSISTDVDSPVAPGGSTSFDVRVDALSSGTYKGLVSFHTNVAGKETFDFNITARVNDQDSVDYETEAMVPNASGSGTGDGNGDGIADMNQGSVVSLLNYDSSSWVTASTANPENYPITDIQMLPSPTDAPDGLTFPYGLFGITVTGLPADGSGSAKIEIYVPYDENITGYWKKDKNGDWVEVNAVIEPVGTSKTKISFTLQDNGPLDLDDTPGIIVDPGGPVVTQTVAVPLLGRLGSAMLALLMMAGGVLLGRKRG